VLHFFSAVDSFVGLLITLPATDGAQKHRPSFASADDKCCSTLLGSRLNTSDKLIISVATSLVTITTILSKIIKHLLDVVIYNSIDFSCIMTSRGALMQENGNIKVNRERTIQNLYYVKYNRNGPPEDFITVHPA
jgi:hypothetical protein